MLRDCSPDERSEIRSFATTSPPCRPARKSGGASTPQQTFDTRARAVIYVRDVIYANNVIYARACARVPRVLASAWNDLQWIGERRVIYEE